MSVFVISDMKKKSTTNKIERPHKSAKKSLSSKNSELKKRKRNEKKIHTESHFTGNYIVSKS